MMGMQLTLHVLPCTEFSALFQDGIGRGGTVPFLSFHVANWFRF